MFRHAILLVILDEEGYSFALLEGELIRLKEKTPLLIGEWLGAETNQESKFLCISECILARVPLNPQGEFSEDNLTDMLSDCTYFDHIDKSSLNQIIKYSNRKTFLYNDWVCHEGDQTACIYFIIDGNFTVNVFLYQ